MSSQLPVFVFSGNARSGKGTTVKHLAATHKGVAVEEAGVDHRLITRILISDGVLTPSMLPRVATQKALGMDAEVFATIVANRESLIEGHGRESLECPDVSALVGSVSPIRAVQNAVDAGFRQRVERVVEAGKAKALLLNHRSPEVMFAAISGARILMRTFVHCLPIEAAWRECARLQVPLGSKEVERIYEAIKNRNQIDATRAVNPVRPDSNAINYWDDYQGRELTVQRIAQDQFDGDIMEAICHTFGPGREYTDVVRYGIGSLAVASGRQVFFETSPFRSYDNPKEGMLQAASVMFDEALATLSN